jgi:hypothetical protein
MTTIDPLWRLRPAFDPDVVAAIERQEEARQAWIAGRHRQLIEGAYYLHRNGGWARRVVRLNGRDVHWLDKWGPSVCDRRTFMYGVSGPL